MEKKKFGIVVIVAIILLIVFASQMGYLPFSIIAMSDVTLADGGQYILVSAVVDQYDVKYYTLPTFAKEIGDGTTLITKESVGLRFVPYQTTCDYELEPRTKAIRMFGVPVPGWNVQYYVPRMPALPNVPFRIDIEQGGVFDPALSKTIDVYSAPTTTFDTINAGQITVSKIGDLSTGYVCPDHQFAVLFNPFSNKWEVASLAALESHIDNASDDCFGFQSNFNGCLNNIIRLVESEYKPSGIVQCPTAGECRIGYIQTLIPTNVAKGKFVYNLQGTASKLITITFNKEFVKGIIFDPSVLQPKVEIDETTFALKVNQTRTITAKISNLSDWDASFNIQATSKYGRFAISPTTISNFGPIPAQYGTNQAFSLTGLLKGSDEFCVKAISPSQFGDGASDEDCVTIGVTGQQTISCGNFTCETWLGENYQNCPEDCESEPDNCSELKGDGIFILGYTAKVTTPPWWMFWVGQTEECIPQYNVPLIILGIMAIIAMVFAMFVLQQRRK